MSQFRHRHRAAVLAVGLIIGAPLLADSAAAEPVAAEATITEPTAGRPTTLDEPLSERHLAAAATDRPVRADEPRPAGRSTAADKPVESGRRVVFSGNGLLGVSCAANPSTSSVTVAAETTLQVVNRTGHRATLVLDGMPRGEISRGSTAEVLFHRGPVLLSLKPHCMLAQERAVRVQVVPKRRPGGDWNAPYPTQPPMAAPGMPYSPGHPVAPGAGEPPDGGQGGLGPTRPGNGNAAPGGRPGPGVGNEGTGKSPMGRGATDRGAGQHQVTGLVTGQRGGSQDGRPKPAGSSGSPGGTITQGPMDKGAPAGAAAGPGGAAELSDDSSLAAEPMGSVEPISDQGPIGLLALIAIVCVLGAVAGAIRAILAQRASRAIAA